MLIKAGLQKNGKGVGTDIQRLSYGKNLILLKIKI
jgi:hypothetical protein